jgi:hypothetical protein
VKRVDLNPLLVLGLEGVKIPKAKTGKLFTSEYAKEMDFQAAMLAELQKRENPPNTKFAIEKSMGVPGRSVRLDLGCYDSPLTSLAALRLIWEFKLDKNLKANEIDVAKGQLVQYLFYVLSLQLSAKIIIGFLCTEKMMWVFRAIKSNEPSDPLTYTVWESELCAAADVLEYVKALLWAKNHELFVAVDAGYEFSSTAFLGKGATSQALSGHLGSEAVVLKHPRVYARGTTDDTGLTREEELAQALTLVEAEKAILAALAAGNVPGVPEVVPCNDKLPCGGFLMRPVGLPMPLVEWDHAMACELLDTLEAAHALGIVHRDIRPANIMKSGTNVLLIDWGFSVQQADPLISIPYSGAPRPFRRASNTGAKHVPAPRDDLYAFAICVVHAVAAQLQHAPSLSVSLTRLASESVWCPKCDSLDYAAMRQWATEMLTVKDLK